MSLISNLTGSIAQIQQGNILSPGIQFDLNDKTFADILEKQMNTSAENSTELINNLGAPAGFEMQDFYSNGQQNTIIDVAKKQAVNMYNKYAKSVVTDLGDFVSDSLRILK